MSLDNAIERLRNALQMHNENRTTMQSLASSVGDFLRYAATLRQQAGRVDGAMVVRACEAAELYNSSTLITTGAMRAALTAALAQNTQGDWVLVPREPTPEMRAAFRADSDALTYFTHTTLQCADFDSRYRAMLGAAPSQRAEVK